MKDNPKISVIVPVYGVEKYIGNCIRTICGQTWKNLEILLIDDGSPDRCGEICEEWARKDSRIRVFHVENGGQSRARNIGMEAATGDYIGFVDGDDSITSRMYETLLEAMEESGATIGECNFIGRKSPEPDRIEEGKRIRMEGKEALRRQLDSAAASRFPSTSLWSKLFEASLIRELRLPEGRIHEEYAFLCQAFCGCRRYVYVNETLYCRTLRGDSTTAAAFSVRTLDKLEVYRQRSDYLKRKGEEKLYALSRAQEFELMLHYYGEASRTGLTEVVKQLEAEMKRNRQEILSSGLSEKKKGQYRLFFLSPKLYAWIRNRRL